MKSFATSISCLVFLSVLMFVYFFVELGLRYIFDVSAPEFRATVIGPVVVMVAAIISAAMAAEDTTQHLAGKK